MIFIYAEVIWQVAEKETLQLPAPVWENSLLVRLNTRSAVRSYFVTILTARGNKCQANFNQVGATVALNDNSFKFTVHGKSIPYF